MYDWSRIKNYTLQEYLFDITITGFNDVKWRLFFDFVKTSNKLITVNYYDPNTDKNYETYDDMIYELINIPEFNLSLNLEYGEIVLCCMFNVIADLDITVNTDAIRCEEDFLELKKIIEKICKKTNTQYYKITPENQYNEIIYEHNVKI